ncbi:MAG: hypothetical protein IT445_08600 [Phycisphaeraceae bacterium]|nr:hypothetical protein [Phycisphaeraceae bacterium]
MACREPRILAPAGRAYATAGVVLALLASTAVSALGQSDNFNDNVRGPQWSLLEDSPSELSLAEIAGRVQVAASDPASSSTDALYLSNGTAGFRLATDADFQITLDYNFGSYDDTGITNLEGLALVFGVGRDLDGTDSAAIGVGPVHIDLGFGAFTTPLLVGASRTDDVQSEAILSSLFPPAPFTAGTFIITYNAAGDDLILASNVTGTSPYALNDTVQSIWNADALYVSLGARGSGITLTDNNTFFDNFTIVTGHVMFDLHPGDANGDGLVNLADLQILGDNWLNNSADWSMADFTGDNLVNLSDLQILGDNWGFGVAPDIAFDQALTQAGLPVPEPATTAMMALMPLLALLRRDPRGAFGRR